MTEPNPSVLQGTHPCLGVQRTHEDRVAPKGHLTVRLPHGRTVVRSSC
jgi:hypothetical protein